MASENVNIAVRMPKFLCDKIDKEAEEKGITRSDVIRYAMVLRYSEQK